MTITFKYSPELLQRAHELHYKKFFPLRGKILLFLGLLSVWAGLLLLLVKGSGRNLWYSLPLIIYGIIAVAAHFYMGRTIGKRAFRRLSDYHEPMEMEIDESAISLTIKNHKSIIPWSDFKKALIADQMVLLYPRDTVFFIFPRQQFTPEEYADFCELVKGKVEKVH